MSSSPHETQEDAADQHSPDDVEDPQILPDAGDGATSPQEPQQTKRSRGRPPGSRNKKNSAQSPTNATGSSAPAVRRKRGRPPKSKPDDSADEPPVKRSRGRPRKNPQPTDSADAEGSEPAQKRKRGRPKKATT
ncbi:hypothetical protein AMATHDRAFT_3740 [Amanita thiersii Skay4041]|uniref:Uncharacterized protein n=1 Tax=Amanita thiersii Skay4041 TaxID=703135 RepID=A0A2A9NSM5_9AGAR|nr:hypothetical protein AMATHDRAFT_3740 [Amanita thiersii Skay4041]